MRPIALFPAALLVLFVASRPRSSLGDTNSGESPVTTQQVVQQANRQLRAEAETNEHGYRDIPDWRSAPAAGSDFGYGTVFPSLRTGAFALHGRLGVALETPTRLVLVLAGQSGVTLAFNTGSSSPSYGYLVRIPIAGASEVIYSRLVDYRHLRYLNFHAGVSGGPEFLLAAQCVRGSCNYVQPNVYWGVGPRVGLSYSAVERSSVGMFITWQSDFAPCPPNSGESCATYLSTLMWSVGWTLF